MLFNGVDKRRLLTQQTAECKRAANHEEVSVPLSMVTGAVLAGSRTVLGPGSVLGGWTGSGKPGDWLKKKKKNTTQKHY